MSDVPIYEESIQETKAQFALARDYITEARTTSQGIIESLIDVLKAITPVDTNVNLVNVSGGPSVFPNLSGVTPSPPTSTVDVSGKPDPPSINLDLTYTGSTLAGPYTSPTQPTFDYTVTPGNLVMSFPYAPPAVLDLPPTDLSGSPDISGESMVIPPVDSAQITYDSALLTTIRARLLADVQTDIDRPSIETAKWDRAKARDEETHSDLLDAIRADWSKSGLPLPDGALLAAVEKENTRYGYTRDDRSGQIAIEEANLAIKVRQDAVVQAVQLENILMNFLNTVKERLFQASKATADGRGMQCNLIIGKYRIMTEIYQAIVNARMADKKNDINVYDTTVGAYKTGVEGEVARVGAEVNKYRTSGDLKIAEGKAIQVDGYATKVSGWKAGVDADVATVGSDVNKYQIESNVQIERVRALVQKFIGEVTGYKAYIDAQAAKVDAEAKVFSSETEAFKGDVSAYDALLRFDASALETQGRMAVSRGDLNLKNGEMQIKEYEALTGMKIDGMKAIGAFYAQLIAGALSSISARVSIGREDSAGYRLNVQRNE